MANAFFHGPAVTRAWLSHLFRISEVIRKWDMAGLYATRLIEKGGPID
jgi:hypothetical protein